MLQKGCWGFTLVIFFSFLNPFYGFSQGDKTTAETVVHLLSYLAMDYSGAVQDGKIINEMEYKEQQDFAQQAFYLTQNSTFISGTKKDTLLAQMQTLIDNVNNKVASHKIKREATKINDKIILLTALQTSPKIWPSLKNGKRLFEQNCAMCHGKDGKGDGPAGRNIEPKPSNFHDPELMKNFSPYQAYNSIRLGVPGTGMQAYSQIFNNKELWDLAFYVKTFLYQSSETDSIILRKAFKEISRQIKLDDVANWNDITLLDSIRAISDKNTLLKLQSLRVLTPKGKIASNSLPVALKKLNKALESYKNGEKRKARTLAINAYLEGIEPVEAQLKVIDHHFVVELEMHLFAVRQAIKENRGIQEVSVKISAAISSIHQAEKMLQNQEMSFWVTFLLSLSIVLREGLEAFLIIAVLLAVIRSAKVKRALPWLHGGWIFALICGIAGWFLSDYILQFGGKNREVMEGLVALLAVLVLVTVGYWMHKYTDTKKWKEFAEDKIGKYLQKDKMFGLAAFSFMVVFRELFEVILFLQAVNLEVPSQNKNAIGLGVLAAAALIFIIAAIFLKSTKKLPIRQIFTYSTWIILLLAIILMGKGVHALQESGWISIVNLPSMIRVEWLGIFPTLQTVGAQLGLILMLFITYFYQRKNKRND